MSILVTKAKVRFVQDKHITMIPIHDVIEFETKAPAHKKDFCANKLYKGVWKDDKNSKKIIFPIQIGGLACGEKEENLLDKKRISFPSVNPSDLDRFSDSTDGPSHSIEKIEKDNKKLKNKNIKKAVSMSNKKQLSLYKKDIPHFTMRNQIKDNSPNSKDEDEDEALQKETKRSRLQIASDSDSDNNHQPSKGQNFQPDTAGTTVEGNSSHKSIARKLVFDYSGSESDEHSPNELNKSLSNVSTPSHVSNSVNKELIMRRIAQNTPQGHQSNFEDYELNDLTANPGSFNNNNPLNVVNQETLELRHNLQQLVANNEGIEIPNEFPNFPRPKRGYKLYRLRPPKPIDLNNLTEMNVIRTPTEADDFIGEDRTKYEKVDNERIYLGAGKAVDEKYWTHHKKHAPWEFVRETSQLLWGERKLVNRCILLSQTSIRLEDRSPRKQLTPSKYLVLRDIFNDYLDEKEEYASRKQWFFSKMNRHIGYKIKDLRNRDYYEVKDDEEN
ncbi:hypothetical protein TKK_0000188 [Trichogramma kaykai]